MGLCGTGVFSLEVVVRRILYALSSLFRRIPKHVLQMTFGWYKKWNTLVLKCGPIPRHVAFIMDGNRRYARRHNQDTWAGHTMGGETLRETLLLCQELGISDITVFAFSIENFKRATEEVDMLMRITSEKLSELLVQDKHNKVFDTGYRIRVLGNLHLLPIDIQQHIHKLEKLTRNRKSGCLSICFSYTSTDEITSAIRSIVEGIEAKKIEERDINLDLLDRCMYTAGSCEPNLIIRTSGEIRFSDFMLWQCSSSYFAVLDVLWPEFTARHLYNTLFAYQEHHKEQLKLRAKLDRRKYVDLARADSQVEFFNQREELRRRVFVDMSIDV
ncbi:dehydrodolichyl diphosphate synthase complex subunit DHDDS-like [Schistocerca gregaria]|uniref:dehydrodolichyl diphosphate synthase complex subunit DHDDS-like n=1 Tax=Schistocerca gregaria TaxID=7010 RepID=UPI00211F36BA|nr:dehydrodolichyl diphosphate synthase complex subunit DHDDS-like [Schistocerca gregaria]